MNLLVDVCIDLLSLKTLSIGQWGPKEWVKVFYLFWILCTFQGMAFLPSFISWLQDFSVHDGEDKPLAILAIELKKLLKGLHVLLIWESEINAGNE